MLEVIIDTNIIIRAILKQHENNDCWKVLHFLRNDEITAVTSKELEREYILAPTLVALTAMEDYFSKHGYDESLIKKSRKDCFDCANAISEITAKSRKVIVTSRLHACPTDAEDNKLIDLAHDSNCHIIITHNRSDFMFAEDKGVKTQNGEIIQFYEPELFLKCFELTKRNQAKPHNNVKRKRG
jgi:putative PIN family toxin of toxin-antitoxin system